MSVFLGSRAPIEILKKVDKMSKLKISKNNIGVAGEFYMAHVLAKHNFKVNVSLGRTEGFDLFIQNPQGENLTVSVKTTYSNESKFLLMNEKHETLIDESLFYAFVRLNMPDGVPEFWIIPSTIVAPVIKKAYKIWLETPARNGSAHNKTSMRDLYLGVRYNFPDDWAEQLKGFKSNVKSLE